MATNTALLVLDMQNDVMKFQPAETLPLLFDRISRVIAWARNGNIPVIYSRVAYRSSYVDTLPQLPAIKEYHLLDETQPGSAVVEALKPQDNDVSIIKRRVSAFYNTDLELVLRSLGVRTLLYTGVSTARVVESTARCASDRDFRNIVISDGCAADTPEKHENALKSIQDFFGTVMTFNEMVKALD